MTGRTADRVAELLGSEGPLAERYAIVGTLDGKPNLSRWRAEDRETGKPVVIWATTGAVDGEVLAQVRERLEMLSDAPHANVAEVFDFGEFEGLVWAVENQIAQGETLAELLERKGRLTIQELTPIIAQVLKAYGHTHLRGLPVGPFSLDQVHLVERANRLNFVRIDRFGWVNPLLAGDPGDAAVTAPEDLRGVTPTIEADVFIVGRIIFEVLAGARFDMDRVGPGGDDQPCSVDGDMLVELIPEDEGVPPYFYGLVNGALARDPGARPGDANALVEGLIDALPMHMFRLPSRAGQPRTRAGESTASGQSMVLTGSWLAAAERQAARAEQRAGLDDSSEDLTQSTSARVAALTASQSMRSEPPSASSSSNGQRSAPTATRGNGGMSSAIMAAGAVALLAIAGLAVFMIANPGRSSSASSTESTEATAAADQAEPVAGAPQRVEPRRKGAAQVEPDPETPVEPDPDLLRKPAAPAEPAQAEASDHDATAGPRSGQSRKRRSKRRAGQDTETEAPTTAEAEADEPPSTSKKKDKKSDGLIGPGGASASTTKPSTKSSDAFLPPTGN